MAKKPTLRTRAGSGSAGSSTGTKTGSSSERTLTAKESRSALGRLAKRPRLASAKSRIDMRVNGTAAGASKDAGAAKSRKSPSPLTLPVKCETNVVTAPTVEVDPDASAKLDALAALLDLSALSSHTDIQLRFGQIARALIHDHVLVVTTDDATRTEYDILEIEFYLRKEGHDDPFAHGAHEQQVSGYW